MRLLAVASREPAACQALAWRISSHRGDERRGRDAKPSGLSSILMDVALHALLQWSGGNAEGHSSSSREAAEAQLAAAVVLSSVADAAAAATQGPGRFRTITEPARLQVCSGRRL